MSEDKTNILPPLPEKPPELLKDRKWFGTDTTGLLLDFAKPYTPPKWTLSHNGISFAKRGDLHIVGGKAGHGKTAFMSQIMAAILSGKFGGMQCQIQGDNPSVLYIDTEQSEDDTIAIKNRVCTLAGIDDNKPSDRFKVARLRDTTQAEDRYKQILQLMWEIEPTVVFIDGLLDIVNDYNDQQECSVIIRELMAWSTAKNISMWCVLHENPMTDKLVGSLGSIAERKVTEVFIIRKHKAPHQDKRFKDFPNVFFEIKQTKARGKDQEDWYFVVEDRAMGWGVPVELGVREEEKKKYDPRTIKAWITNRQQNVEWPASRSTIIANIFEPEGVVNEDDQKEVMQISMNSRFFLEQPKEEMKKGQKVPRLYINEQLIFPF
ncbi:MAG: AAA family ATPase [Mogibacterium sp.]|nr:AAA family ATPase [Aeriscardovia sp.]MBR3330734.1 AAA family ATPase [Mogibacterium sp.]MBR6037001.1 AAA family ATPase [Bacteroidaceae bacterium]MBR6590699.1 AAA family ATPase [Bacteroidaceae bacterium]MBR6606308.1 AAA family ATPase [Prevotella sp.]